jgi:hypothetical protein
MVVYDGVLTFSFNQFVEKNCQINSTPAKTPITLGEQSVAKMDK